MEAQEIFSLADGSSRPYKSTAGNRERSRRHRKTDPEKLKEYFKKYAEKNKDKIGAYHRAWYAKNSERIRAKAREWWKANPVRARRYNIGKSFKITASEYDALLSLQSGRCAICNMPETAIDKRKGTVKRLAVDHCHKTDSLRGLLCQACNISIGRMNDDPCRLRKAADYVERHSSVHAVG
jgi:hypothetical protein